ncbi:MAG: hypothetical protein ACEPOV_05825 [Hyphomicrobiales bacterium]
MKLKLTYKSFVSSLKKVILKLKEKVTLCAKQIKPTTQAYNEITGKLTDKTKTDNTATSNFINLILIINKSIQRKKAIAIRWIYPANVVCRATEIDFVFNTSPFRLLPRYNIQTHPTYYKSYFYYSYRHSMKGFK